jgi:hypothetical protein
VARDVVNPQSDATVYHKGGIHFAERFADGTTSGDTEYPRLELRGQWKGIGLRIRVGEWTAYDEQNGRGAAVSYYQ